MADRPALDEANQQAKGYLNLQNRRQNRPGEMNGMAERHKKSVASRSLVQADQHSAASALRSLSEASISLTCLHNPLGLGESISLDTALHGRCTVVTRLSSRTPLNGRAKRCR
jgi:hypothetical protein